MIEYITSWKFWILILQGGLGTTENYTSELWKLTAIHCTILVNYVIPQINFKKHNLLLAITQKRMQYVTISVILFLKFCGTTYLTSVDINNLIMRPEMHNE